ncbi:ScbA/BarX family gamma-butyrolactone biosynthesis protein [Nocardia sp. NPDC052566]|uniref:ScbA/BarX family gamma-butyrolactone biosynthesis protein n=1 Tax=Nocardia sp. NPDC052566 TaxID=3364330 RepID=UPI0037C6D602
MQKTGIARILQLGRILRCIAGSYQERGWAVTVEIIGQERHLWTVSRRLVHRRAVAEVFVTSLEQLSSSEFAAGVQLPRTHAFFGDHSGVSEYQYDPLAVMEAARQAAIAISQQYFDVPYRVAYILRTFSGQATDSTGWYIGGTPADLLLTVRVSRVRQRDNVVHGLDMTLTAERDGEPLMAIDGTFSWLPPDKWSALRTDVRKQLGLGEFDGSPAPGPRAHAALVRRKDPRNVVIGPPVVDAETARAALVVDTTHPTLFDYQLDHVPGTLLIEACRQTALVGLGVPDLCLRSVSSSFERFVELDIPAECVAVTTDSSRTGGEVTCRVVQHGAPAAHVTLRFKR